MTLEENIEEKLSSHLTAVDKMVSVERISLNVSQSVIVTTEDKIRLSLASFVKNHNKRSDWLAPFSLLLSIVATLSTATFSDFILEAATWKAILV